MLLGFLSLPFYEEERCQGTGKWLLIPQSCCRDRLHTAAAHHGAGELPAEAGKGRCRPGIMYQVLKGGQSLSRTHSAARHKLREDGVVHA